MSAGDKIKASFVPASAQCTPSDPYLRLAPTPIPMKTRLPPSSPSSPQNRQHAFTSCPLSVSLHSPSPACIPASLTRPRSSPPYSKHGYPHTHTHPQETVAGTGRQAEELVGRGARADQISNLVETGMHLLVSFLTHNSASLLLLYCDYCNDYAAMTLHAVHNPTTAIP